jgi:putative oxidoreductase
MSDVGSALARVMLALIFIIGGYSKLMAVAGIAGMLQKAGFPEPRLFGYAVGALELIGGVMILLGFKTRWAAAALFVFTAGTIFISHKFWIDASQQTQALKNLAIMGGYLLLVVNGGGRLSIDRR